METIPFTHDDKLVTITLHRSDFSEIDFEKFKTNTYWYHVIFAGNNIIRLVTYESNYSSIAEKYNFNE